jgi:hypothetical protein
MVLPPGLEPHWELDRLGDDQALGLQRERDERLERLHNCKPKRATGEPTIVRASCHCGCWRFL